MNESYKTITIPVSAMPGIPEVVGKTNSLAERDTKNANGTNHKHKVK